MPISRSHWMSSLLSVILDWRHWSGRHQYLSWHWPCHWLREPLQLAFWVCPGVEAAKSRKTIFDFVFESPSFHLTTTFNLALLLLAAVNAVSLHHHSLMELNLSPYTVNLWFDQSHWFWHSEGGQRFWSFHLRLRSDLRVPEIYWRRARQFLCKNCRKKLIEPLSCLLRRVFPLSLLMLWMCIVSKVSLDEWNDFVSPVRTHRTELMQPVAVSLQSAVQSGWTTNAPNDQSLPLTKQRLAASVYAPLALKLLQAANGYDPWSVLMRSPWMISHVPSEWVIRKYSSESRCNLTWLIKIIYVLIRLRQCAGWYSLRIFLALRTWVFDGFICCNALLRRFSNSRHLIWSHSFHLN